MAVMLRRPVLIGGIGLSFSMWALQGLHHSVAQMGEFGVIGAIALGAGFWLFQQGGNKNPLELEAKTLNREIVEKAIAQAETIINQLQTEAENYGDNPRLRQQLSQLTTELDRKNINIAVTGGKGTGKSTLMQILQENSVTLEPLKAKSLKFSETSGLFTNSEASGWEDAIASDLLLFITNGDLTDSEFQTLQQLVEAKNNLVLVLNKQDQYLSDERALLLQQLRQHIQGILNPEDVVAIAAAPNPIKVRQHQPDGSIKEWLEQPQPDTLSLTDKLSQIITQESQQLICATTWRKAIALKTAAKTVLNQVRSDRAIPLIEQYQWIAAATAFANPVAALDLLATAAINAQMIIDLGAIYQQKLSFEQAKTIAGTMGSLMLKLGLVELSTQTISSVLKTNAITYVAGGLVQGVSAAYLTRLAGLSLVEYFQEQDLDPTGSQPWNIDQLGQMLQKIFQQNQRVAWVQSFVKQAVSHILPESQVVEVSKSL